MPNEVFINIINTNVCLHKQNLKYMVVTLIIKKYQPVVLNIT